MDDLVKSNTEPSGEDGELVFCRSYRHPKTGKTVYPKNGRLFAFRVRGSKTRSNSKQLKLPLSEPQKKQQ